jgi:flavin-dependent dehydrogenase
VDVAAALRPATRRDAVLVLLLAAVGGGWWYVSQSATGAAVVYLTDADLLPRSAYARSIHLGRAFDEASLLREWVRAAPAFSSHRVVDARTSHRLKVGGDGWMAIGDAALSVDPLSGEGLRLAIASAARASEAITDSGRDLPAWESLAAWFGDQRTEQRQAAAAANAAVVRRFADDLFWRRRDAVGGHVFSAAH